MFLSSFYNKIFFKMSFSNKSEILIFFLIIFSIQGSTSRLIKNPSTNYIENEDESLPFCKGEFAVCGMVQWNNWGTFSQPICRCRKNFKPLLNTIGSVSPCPLNWDSSDGQTQTHAFDQYKYCGPAPDLKFCKLNQPAYMTLTRINKSTGDLIENTNLVLCKCRFGHILLPDNKSIKFFELKDQSVQLMHHYCSQIPICLEGQICSAVTRTNNSTLVKQNCECPVNQICPSNSLAYASEKQDFPKGSIYTYKCMFN